jgi:Flp pilus assembly protein TadD
MKLTTVCCLLLVVIATQPEMSMAGDVKLPLPGKDTATPIQRLNRDGVKELEKHKLESAKQLFYRAYLMDPNDPFTLNNLGYVAELEGDADRALRYYELSSQSTSEAKISLATKPGLKGHDIRDAYSAVQVPELKANKANVQAIGLLGQGRVSEAEAALRRALAEVPASPFTLNNLGYVMEIEGDQQAALRYYNSAAATHSQETVVIAPDARWRGQPIGRVAFENARVVSQVIARGEDLNAQVARLNMRGVAAINHNDPQAARQFFQQAYQLDPHNAFSLNNMGYLAEMNGDPESAESYYQEAQTTLGIKQRVTYATRREAEGKTMSSVAGTNETVVDTRIEALSEIKRRQEGPLVLKRRGNAADQKTAAPAADTTQQPASTTQEQGRKQEPPLPVATPALPSPQLPEQNPSKQNDPQQ